MRDAEGRRGKLYEVLETHGKAALGIADMAPRLRELNEQVKRLEAALVAIEDEQEPLVPRLAASAEEAARVMREMVLGCENPRTVRDFAASIIDRIEVGPTEIRVDYHPECLLRDGGALVHSTRNWLPDLGSNQGPTD